MERGKNPMMLESFRYAFFRISSVSEGHLRQNNNREDRHIIRHVRITPTVSFSAILTHAASSPWPSMSARKISRRLSGGIVFSDESRFNLGGVDSCVRVWKPRSECRNPTFTVLGYNSRTTRCNNGTMCHHIRYMVKPSIDSRHHDRSEVRPRQFSTAYFATHARAPMSQFSTAQCCPIHSKGSQGFHGHNSTIPSPNRSPDLSPVEHISDHLRLHTSRTAYEIGLILGAFTANVE
ncbi:hypothetical protein TNCV_2117051 [Trichonephila clavipes]|nr:hypothetical protein TNCV_2117051 [Trichonephila clavipes]